ncbi:DUF4393 domain-containing protein [Carnobacterium pleistocenium]|uniref:DUF4393 domain-containing protein n=1 Tax=Carnobacterium pleistocenium TaxID=181073 RepID=UPI000689765B|nr:DUF4393 domain-containing protein [Carnobacterium pleistocenium]
MDPTLLTMATAFGTSLATNTGSQLFSGPMQTLNDWWYVKYGHKSSEERALLVAAQEQKVNLLKSEIFEKVTDIPDEHLQEPPISILGPAIEASRFYIDEEEIRKMFANLISSSLDQRKNETIHHSFVEIIKQMSPNDADIFALFSQQKALPFVDYKITHDSFENKVINSELFFMELGNNYNMHSISIINLERLGLIKINNDKWLIDETEYDKFSNNNFYLNLKENNSFEAIRKDYAKYVDFSGREEAKKNLKLDDDQLNKNLKKSQIAISKGVLTTTPLGSAFLKICF